MILVQLAMFANCTLIFKERNCMVKMYVDIEKFDSMPRWAKNYFKKNWLVLRHIKLVKIKYRKECLETMSNGPTFGYIKNLISANNRGRIFFYWEDPQDLTKFLLEWA